MSQINSVGAVSTPTVSYLACAVLAAGYFAMTHALDRVCPDYVSLLHLIGDAADPSEDTDEDGRARDERLMERYEYYSKLSDTDSEFAKTLIFLAIKYDSHHQFSKAQARFERAIDILKSCSGSDLEYERRQADSWYAQHKAAVTEGMQSRWWDPPLSEPHRISP